MVNLQSIYEAGNVNISLFNFSVSIIISYILGYLLSIVYVKNAKTLSNHESLSRIFPILAVTVTIVIAVVKSSLALSLGLVGALSIVRFRTPIKEPEELTYLFLCIAIGLATGADQYLTAVIGFVLISLGVVINNRLRRKRLNKNALRLSIRGININDLSDLVNITSNNAYRIDFNSLIIEEKKIDSNTAVTLSILLNSFYDTKPLIENLNDAFPNASISIIDIKNF